MPTKTIVTTGLTVSSFADALADRLSESEHDNGNSGAAKTIDPTNGAYQKVTVDQDTTLTMGTPAGSITRSLTLSVINGGASTVTWSGVQWAGGTAPTLTAAGTDVLVFSFDGTVWHGAAGVLDSQ